MPVYQPYVGLPGIGAERIANHRLIAADGYLQFLPGGVTLDGAKTRDVGNTDYNATTNPYAMHRLQAGVMLGKVTSSGKYANSFLGYSNGALAGNGTSLTLASTRHARELVRRIGSSGTLKLIGPPTASGTVRAVDVTFSAVDTSTGVVTITAPSVNEVQTVTFNIAATGGSVVLRVPKANGEFVLTTPASWSATDATFLSNINTVLDAATGVTGGIVASAISATDTDLGFKLTFSGTGYAGLPQPTEMVSVETLPTSSTSYAVTRTTTGVDGRFVTGSLVADTDGSHLPLLFVPDGWERNVPEDSTDVYLAQPPIAGNVDMSRLLPYWPADASLKQWCRDYLNSYGKFVDTSKY